MAVALLMRIKAAGTSDHRLAGFRGASNDINERIEFNPPQHKEAADLIAQHGIGALNESLIAAFIAGKRGDLVGKGMGLAVAFAVHEILGIYPRGKIDMDYVQKRVSAAE